MPRNKGLTTEEVARLRKKYGGNTLPEKDKSTAFSVFISQLKGPLIFILICVSIISLLFREYLDVVLISSVIALNVIMGFFQEYKAKKTLEALNKMVSPTAFVLRNGKSYRIEAKDLVPGDLVIVNSGDVIPADGKVLEGINLFVREAILTGEEEAVPKKLNAELFMGTTVVSGRGTMEVEKIGIKTKVGEIGISLTKIEEGKTPIQKNLEKFARSLTYLVIGITFLIFIVGLIQGKEIWSMLRISIILAVAAIPESLMIAVTVILSLGMKRILKRHGLVKRLLSVETLGSTTVICTDKTGTLTEGIMKVEKYDFKDIKKAVKIIALTNARKSNLEISLWEFIKENGQMDLDLLLNKSKRVFEEPFSSETKYTLTVNENKEKRTSSLIGAPEKVLSFCSISKDEVEMVENKVDNWADQGLKVLALAIKENGDLKEKKNFTFIGIIGIEDPLREEVVEAVGLAQDAGIKIKIVTGDHRRTAEKIAVNLGFTFSKDNVIEGKELDNLTDEQLRKRVESILIFSRVTPHHKLRIVDALQDNGEVVAMTGDGVNDAQALKQADIGVVMGDSSDTAKEAGDLILLDNNFITIVAACEEGRLIYSNIKKVIGYSLSNSLVEIIIIFGAMLLGLPIPLTIVQILWTHLICDGPPDIVLGFESNREGLMKEKPINIAKQSILDKSLIFLIFSISGTIGIVTLLYFIYFYNSSGNIDFARTIVFAAVGSVDLIYIFAYKDLKKSIFKMKDFFKNTGLFLAVIYGFILLLGAIYLPPLNKLLGTTNLQIEYWVPVLAVGIFSIVLVEVAKLVNNRLSKTIQKSP